MGKVGNSLVLFAVTIMFAAFTWMSAETEHALAVRGVQTDAVIVDQSFKAVTLRFSDQTGKTVETVTNSIYGTPRPATGDVIKVVYDPQAPTERVRDVRISGGPFMTVLLALATVAAGCVGILVALGVIDVEKLSRRWG